PKAVTAFPGAGAESIHRGRELFASIGCALCHTPALSTGRFSALASMNDVAVQLYSDLLLHHMGPKLADDVAQAPAGPHEFRTRPRWGLGQLIFFLHDGRTTDLISAIREHKSSGGGFVSEGNAVIDRFDALNDREHQDLLNFLRSL